MKAPRQSQVYKRENYWQRVEAMRTENGLPVWAFNFLSIHPQVLTKDNHIGFGFVAPMCVVEALGMMRHEFEGDAYAGKKQAIAAARKMAKVLSEIAGTTIHVVDCIV